MVQGDIPGFAQSPHKEIEPYTTSKSLPLERKALRECFVANLFGLDDFAVLVVAAIGANTVRELDLATLRAHAASRCVDAVMAAAASMGADTAHALFRYCHCSLSPLTSFTRVVSAPFDETCDSL